MNLVTIKKIALFVFISIFSGCYTFNLYLAKPDIKTSGKGTVSIATLDQREYILSKQSDPKYVGTLRGGYGNPFNVLTDSGKPLSDDISIIIYNSITKNGYTANTVSTTPSLDSGETIEKLKLNAADKYIFVRVKELRCDAMMVTSYFSNLEIEVYDKNMKLIASNSHHHGDTLGAAFSMSGLTEQVIGRIKLDLEQLINNEKIINALK